MQDYKLAWVDEYRCEQKLEFSPNMMQYVLEIPLSKDLRLLIPTLRHRRQKDNSKARVNDEKMMPMKSLFNFM